MRVFCFLVLVTIGLGSTTGAQAQDWLFVQAHRLPNDCRDPGQCLSRSVSVLRNLFHLSTKDQNALLSTLNSLAMLRGLPEPNVAPVMDLKAAVPILHQMELAGKPDLLAAHPGVLFDPAKLDSGPISAGFSAVIRKELSALGLRFLTEEEWEQTPGRPKLSIRFSARTEVEGCIVPFYVSFTLTEELALARDPTLKITGTVWSATVRENLANKHYMPESALRDVLNRFKSDWVKANG